MGVTPRTLMAGIAAGALGLAALASVQGPAAAAPPSKPAAKKVTAAKSKDNFEGPLDKKQKAIRETALKQLLSGKARVQTKNGGQVVKVAKGQYAQASRTKTEKVFGILAEFGDKRHPDFPDKADPNDPNPPTVFDGPRHNQIAKPDRTKDNVTIWKKDFNRDHFKKLYFNQKKDTNTVASYFYRQSSGKYTINGTVSDWVKLPYNEARYGRNNASGNDGNPWAMVADGVNTWYELQVKAGRSEAEIKKTLRSYDQQDRYDFDGDGNFYENDGYIDHFQIVHGGNGEETGFGAQGSDAIWSHRWYAYATDFGQTGPGYNKAGGTQIGKSGIWVGDYTTQPENGGVGVFTHEYAHDLGLPDLYDTTRAGDSPVGFWSLMSTGSHLMKDRVNGRGTQPGDMNAWDKLQLGWLDYKYYKAGKKKKLNLSPTSKPGKYDEALVVGLPKKEKVLKLSTPPEGKNAWWSTKGDDLSSTLTRDVEIPQADKAELSFKTWYQAETDYDFGYLEVSTGGDFKTVKGNLTDDKVNNGIHGVSGGSSKPEEAKWVDANFDLSAYAGKKVQLRFRYQTDGGVAWNGFMMDQFKLTAGDKVVFEDNAENGNNGWTPSKFKVTTGTEVTKHSTYYIAENRQWLVYDASLKNSYNWIDRAVLKGKIEHYKSYPGLLLSYWDTSQEDNNVSEHPGEGEILHIDASPKPVPSPRVNPDTNTKFWDATQQIYDAAFGKSKIPAMTLHQGNEASVFPAHNGVTKFDDTKTYWYQEQPQSGVKLQKTGVTIKVLKQKGNVLYIQLSKK